MALNISAGATATITNAALPFARASAAYSPVANSSVTSGNPRYVAIAGTTGVFVEQAKTNLLKTIDFETNFTTNSDNARTTNAASSAEAYYGTQSLQMIYGTSTGNWYINTGGIFTATSSTQFVCTAYIKRSDGAVPVLANAYLYTSQGNAVLGSGNWTVTADRNGWYRVDWWNQTASAGTLSLIGFTMNSTGGGVSIYLDAVSVCTGLIPSTHVDPQSTRAADVLSAPVSALINPSAGAVVMKTYFDADFVSSATSNYRYLFDFQSSAGWDGIYLRKNLGSGVIAVQSANGSTATTVSNTLTASVGWHIVAVRWSATDLSVWIDGTKLTTVSSSPNLPTSAYTANTLYLGCQRGGTANFLNSAINGLQVYSYAPSDTEMGTISTSLQSYDKSKHTLWNDFGASTLFPSSPSPGSDITDGDYTDIVPVNVGQSITIPLASVNPISQVNVMTVNAAIASTLSGTITYDDGSTTTMASFNSDGKVVSFVPSQQTASQNVTVTFTGGTGLPAISEVAVYGLTQPVAHDGVDLEAKRLITVHPKTTFLAHWDITGDEDLMGYKNTLASSTPITGTGKFSGARGCLDSTATNLVFGDFSAASLPTGWTSSMDSIQYGFDRYYYARPININATERFLYTKQFTMAASTTYTISFKVRYWTNSFNILDVYLLTATGTGTQIQYNNTGSGLTPTAVPGVWQEVKVTVTTTGDLVGATGYVRFDHNGNNTAYYDVADVQVDARAYATPYVNFIGSGAMSYAETLPILGSGDVTVAGWFKFYGSATDASNRYIVATQDSTISPYGNVFALRCVSSSTALSFWSSDSTGNTTDTISSGDISSFWNTWTHVAIVMIKGTVPTGRARKELYINGALVASSNPTVGNLPSFGKSLNLKFGTWFDNAALTMRGALCEWRVDQRAAAPQEIASWASATAPFYPRGVHRIAY